MITCVKKFEELSAAELYRLLKLRVDVFVVEQNCPYAELDDCDQEALHIWMEDEEGIQAYLRVLDRGVRSEWVSIGRVVAVKRRAGLGTKVLEIGIRKAKEVFGADLLYVEAQCYARSLYEKLGFQACSEAFLEDGIPHIRMILNTNEN